MTEIIVTAKQLPDNNDRDKIQSETKIGANVNKNINFSTVQKMVNKFLSCDRMVTEKVRRLKYTKLELAEKLNITPKTLQSLKLPYGYKAMARRITLPLARLYCSTEWADE